MSGEEEFENDEINEDLIYQQMFEAIAEELHIEDNSDEETPNIDSLSLTKQQVQEIRKGGIQVFKNIMQARFRQSIEEESSIDNNLPSQTEEQQNQQINSEEHILNENNIHQKNEKEIVQIPNHSQIYEQINENQAQMIHQLVNYTDTDLQKTEISQNNQQQINHQEEEEEEQVKKTFHSQGNQLDDQQTNINEQIIGEQNEEEEESHRSQRDHKEQNVEDSQQNNNFQEQYNRNQDNKQIMSEAQIREQQSFEDEDDYDDKFQNMNINSENISPIAKKDRKVQQEEYFSNPNKQTTYSLQNSAQKYNNNSANAANSSNEKQQDKKNSQKIITDIFSLSGVKVGKVKSMTPMGMNSASITTSQYGNNRRDFNQSSLTQYQYDSTISNLIPRSPNEQDSAIARMYRKHEDVKEKIKKMQEDKINQELSTLKPHPKIAKGSQKILQKSNYQKPSEISSILFKEKQEKRQQLLDEKQKERIEKELEKCTFHPQLVAKTYEEYHGQTRSVNEFYEQQQKWLSNKDKNILSSQLDSIQKELSQTTFHPKINKNSQVQVRTIKVEEKLIQDQEKVLEKRKRMAEQNQPLFKPVILPKSQELARKRKEKEFIPCYEISSKFN